MKVANTETQSIDYRLNILGIRVFADTCQLIAKSSDEWTSLGPDAPLPVQVPLNADELKAAAADTLRLTAYQFHLENPGSDIVDVLSKSKDFAAAMASTLTAAAEPKV